MKLDIVLELIVRFELSVPTSVGTWAIRNTLLRCSK